MKRTKKVTIILTFIVLVILVLPIKNYVQAEKTTKEVQEYLLEEGYEDDDILFIGTSNMATIIKPFYWVTVIFSDEEDVKYAYIISKGEVKQTNSVNTSNKVYYKEDSLSIDYTKLKHYEGKE